MRATILRPTNGRATNQGSTPRTRSTRGPLRHDRDRQFDQSTGRFSSLGAHKRERSRYEFFFGYFDVRHVEVPRSSRPDRSRKKASAFGYQPLESTTDMLPGKGDAVKVHLLVDRHL